MNNIVEIDNNNLGKFLEDFIDSGVKFADELDLFNDDELFASLPYGKIINYITKRIVQINDPNEALKKAIALAVSYNLIVAIKKLKLKCLIDKDTFLINLQSSKAALEKIQTDANVFNIDDFHNNSIVKTYINYIEDIFLIRFNEIQRIKIIQFRNDYLKIDFLKILETQTLAYEKLNLLFKNKSHEEYLILNKKQKYQQDLKNLFNESALNDSAGMTLADIYIEPNFKIHEYCLNDIQEYDDDEDNDSFRSISTKSIHEFLYDLLVNNKLDSNIFTQKDSNLYFILGYPGQGKSSLCKKLMFDVFTDNTSIKKNISFIKIRNITDTLSLINNPIDTLYEHWINEYDLDESVISKRDFQDSVLILDGLDELFMKENLPQRAIDEFCKIMVRETEYKRNLKVIITSRYGYIDIRLLKKTHSLILQLDEFSEIQQLDWLDKFLQFHPEVNLNEEKIHTYNNDAKYKPIKELITQPILLHLIATLNQEVTTEMNRAMIYDRLFTELINRSWAKEGQIDNLLGLEKEDLRDFISDIAFAIFRSGREYIHKTELIKLPETQEFIGKLENKSSMQDILKNIMIAFYFQETKKKRNDQDEEEKNDYAIEFLHKSLMEYLVAEKIWEKLLQFSSKNSRNGKYLVNSAYDGLVVLNDLFKDEDLSLEILRGIIEVIHNSNSNLREELSKRFELFLPEWLEHGLVLKYEWKINNFQGMESNIFTNLFYILTNLVDEKNYFSENKFDFFAQKNLEITLKDQVFTGSFKGHSVFDENINGTTLDIYATEINIVDFVHRYSKDVSFTFDSISIYSSTIDGSMNGHFVNSLFHHSAIRYQNHDRYLNSILSFAECLFHHSSIYSGNMSFVKCKFDMAIFFNFKKQTFKDCIFINCVFYTTIVIDEDVFKGSSMLNCSIVHINEN